LTTQGQGWKRVEQVFHQALEQPPDAREAWLRNACAGDAGLHAEVASLLESDRAAGADKIDAHVRRAVLDLREEEVAKPAMEGRLVGHWRLIRELGQGGMGTVYLAARADQQYESQAAIKLVRGGLDTDFILRRFRRERQILARLEHPNITRMFDGGTTDDGIPYLVMEYIDGLWITRYAAKHKLGVEERLRLCLPVCAAVAYANRNFIVHRDLKPGNILIDANGVPKLLDFGISKLLHADQPEPLNTQAAAMMTPDYASPEQILGDPVTLASDVYSLGAVLYELLTGKRPHRIESCTPLALERAICLDPVMQPSVAAAGDGALSRRLKGDLDNIILHAMQKEPARRYASAEHLAEDLRRFLEHRPLNARPDSTLYRLGKFVRRNRMSVALGSVAALAVVTGALVAGQEAFIAHQRFQDVRRLATTFVFDVESAVRPLPGSTRVRQLIARTGVEYQNKLSRS
jgi:serine/threonine protein kinase